VGLTVLLGIVAAIVVAAAIAGVKVVVVTGGSMQPTLYAGDAAFVQPDGATGVRPGDLIVFRTRPDRPWTIHRVVETRFLDHRRYYVTKGDGNQATDPDLTAAEAVYGRALVRLPRAGHVLRWIISPAARVLLAVVVAAVVIHEMAIIARILSRMRARARTGA
jgi:signal peptidase